MFQLPGKLWLNADKTKAVADGDPEAAFLLGLEGDEITDEEAVRLGLSGAGRATKQSQTAARRAAAQPSRQAQRRGETVPATGEPPAGANAGDAGGEDDEPDGLEDLSDEEIAAMVEELGLELEEGADRETAIAAIRAQRDEAEDEEDAG